MFALDITDGWEEIPGTAGLFAKPLSGDFDEAAGRGYRSLLVRFDKGGETFEPFSHTYWEEVFLVEGELTSKATGAVARAPAYVIRPPGTPHGRWSRRPGAC